MSVLERNFMTRLFPEIPTSEKPDGRTPVAPGQRVGRTVTKESSGKADQPMRRSTQVAPKRAVLRRVELNGTSSRWLSDLGRKSVGIGCECGGGTARTRIAAG